MHVNKLECLMFVVADGVWESIRLVMESIHMLFIYAPMLNLPLEYVVE